MKKIEKIVVKVGTNTVKELGQKEIVKNISALHKKYKVALVSSGAVEEGRTILKKEKINYENLSKKILAGIGSSSFFEKYKKLFLKNKIISVDFLVKELNFKKTLLEVVENNFLAILNGNDVLVGKDLLFDDNDSLGAVVSEKINAGLYVILTDIDGVYDKNPNEKGAQKIKVLNNISEELLKNSQTKGELGTGGMYTKLLAAKKLLENKKNKTDIYITNNFEDLFNFLEEKDFSGTLIKNML